MSLLPGIAASPAPREASQAACAWWGRLGSHRHPGRAAQDAPHLRSSSKEALRGCGSSRHVLPERFEGEAHCILLWWLATPQGALGASGGCCSICLHGDGVSGAAGNILAAQGGCINTGPG